MRKEWKIINTNIHHSLSGFLYTSAYSFFNPSESSISDKGCVRRKYLKNVLTFCSYKRYKNKCIGKFL